MKGIGLRSSFCRQGDWAFDYALSLARHHNCKLNIFHFLESPYTLRRDVVFLDSEKKETVYVTPDFIAKKDQEMREKFDERLGDYIKVGFRLCEGNNEWELMKCFKKGDYEALVIGYDAKGADFGDATTIEEFSENFRGPVVLVGPDRPDFYHVNREAETRLYELLIPDGKWNRIKL
ncbi:MAG: universal stress protein [Desulfomonile tiedjei]|uniref:Universal stress protein n=1 Tax=Desulfomonile tiedjei TaxID=2358 RepID=A0A9D6V0F5_9BACT|nr:universal stress protein [Desulfomonile tiedjei]